MNPKPPLKMQSSMHWLVLYGVARTLYESKAFTVHAGFHGLGHCMSPIKASVLHAEFHVTG